MSQNRPLTPKQARFVAEYCKTLDATASALAAGYSAKTAGQLGWQLLQKPTIAAAVSQKKTRQLESTDLTAARVLEELRRLAFSDVRGLFDEHGNLRPIHTLNDEQAAAISSLEVIVKNAAAGDGHTDTVHKVKVWDKTRSLEMLAKHFALLVERVEITDRDKILSRLHAGRERAKSRKA